MDLILDLLSNVIDTAMSIVPIAAFMLFFHYVVLRRELANPAQLAVGFLFILVGLAIFLLGLEKALFPIGRIMVDQLVAVSVADLPEAGSHWTDYYLIFAFAFAIAFGAAIAEPALLAIASRVSELSGGAIHAWGLRVAAALGVAAGVTIGCIRIAAGIPLHWCMAAGYAVIIVQTVFAPRVIVPLAYDSGGVSTSAVTVPVVTALGLALANQVPGRSELQDGFGLLALACVYPVITVLAYAQVTAFLEKRILRRRTENPPQV
ncbi:MAG TPA: DUF1538 domain-containing protein [Woeseiaceae bacterium]|nr:DUF1538 domain-containing protein [Woeseiaceae bacterium]